jgi:membrane protease YdiL (CAAX protease family)
MRDARQMKIPDALAIWAGVCLVGAFAGTWRGYGGRPFAVALGVFAALFAGQVLLASETGRARIAAATSAFAGYLPLVPFLLYLIYAVGAGQFTWLGAELGLLYALAPAAILQSVRGRPAGRWQDYAAVLFIWIPAELHFIQRLFPYPARGLSHPLWAVFALNVGILAFLMVRRLDGVGYRVAWGRGWGFTVVSCFLLFVVVAIPLGEAIGFIAFGPAPERLKLLPLTALGILFFNAWPEEFLFRGLLQNLLSKSLRSEAAGLAAAAVIFGLAHINNGVFPNWRYAILATLAGLAYGTAWRKTGSIFASALVHSLVNVTWFALFRTL